MDAELKAKWVKALRSGEFKQTRGRLRRDDAYCCLGVLACVAGMPITPDGKHIGQSNEAHDRYEPLRQLLGNYGHLTDMNDGDDGIKQHTFPEIADYIEREL